MYFDFECDFNVILKFMVLSLLGFVLFFFVCFIWWFFEEFVFVIVWEDEEVFVVFVGDIWNEVVILFGMEKYVIECWVYYYENVDS